MKRTFDEFFVGKVSVVDARPAHRGLINFMQESDNHVVVGRTTGLGTGWRSFITERMPITQASVTALHHRVWPGFDLLPAMTPGHFFTVDNISRPGKSSMLVEVMRTFIRAQTGGRDA